jgi:hypothetical protein
VLAAAEHRSEGGLDLQVSPTRLQVSEANDRSGLNRARPMATEPGNPVRLSFQYTLDDFLKADGAHLRRSRFNRLLPWGLLVVLGPLVGLFLLGGGPPKLLVPVLTPEQQARLRALLEERLGPAGRRLAPTPA